MQAAIWTAEYNNGSNSLTVSGGDIDESQIEAITAEAIAAGGGGGQLISTGGIQQQVFDGPVPEPASLSVLAASLFGIIVARRRKS